MDDSGGPMVGAGRRLPAIGVSIRRDRCLGVIVDVNGSVMSFPGDVGQPVRAIAQLPLGDTSVGTVVGRVAELVEARWAFEAQAFSSAATACTMVVSERDVELGPRKAASLVLEHAPDLS